MSFADKLVSSFQDKPEIFMNRSPVDRLKDCSNLAYNEIYKLGGVEEQYNDELHLFSQYITMYSAIVVEYDYTFMEEYYVSNDLEYLYKKYENMNCESNYAKDSLLLHNERLNRFNEYDENSLKDVLVLVAAGGTHEKGTKLSKLLRVVGLHIYKEKFYANKMPKIDYKNDKIFFESLQKSMDDVKNWTSIKFIVLLHKIMFYHVLILNNQYPIMFEMFEKDNRKID